MRRTEKRLPLAALLSLLVAACSTGQAVPKGGTETGNPPFIDETLVALVVSAGELRMVGKPGAVSPGGSELQAVSALTGNTFQARSSADGSFDVLLEASTSDTFELRALSGSAQSRVVYVVRGGSAVGEERGQLSCKQREELAGAQMRAVSEGADRACQVDSDCSTFGNTTLCSESCTTSLVSLAGKQQLEDATAALEDGVCSTFASDGCAVLHLPCPPPPLAVACVAQRCVDASPSGRVDCSADYARGTGASSSTVYWFYRQGHVCLPRTYSGSGGNDNRYSTRAECEASCLTANPSACPPNRVTTEVCVRPPEVPGSCETTRACALLCTRTADCANDPIGAFCSEGGFCESGFLEVP